MNIYRSHELPLFNKHAQEIGTVLNVQFVTVHATTENDAAIFLPSIVKVVGPGTNLLQKCFIFTPRAHAQQG